MEHSKETKQPRVYSLTRDIGYGEFNVTDLNVGMSSVTNRVMFAIDAKTELEDDFRLTLRFLLKSFVTTHESIIALLRHKNELKFDGDRGQKATTLFGPDAMSLVREQIEKVFTVALLIYEPDKWTKVYLQDDWRRLYENYLHEKEEKQKLERFNEFHEIFAPEILNKLQHSYEIDEQQKAWVEFKYANTGVDPPRELNEARIKKFPTAGGVRTELMGTPLEAMLNRLYKEYNYISGYTHSGALKMQMLMMSDRLYTKRFSTAQSEEYFEREILGPSVDLSFCSSLAGCTEVLKYMRDNIEVLAALTEQWERLKKVSLFAKTLWALRGKDQLNFGSFEYRD